MNKITIAVGLSIILAGCSKQPSRLPRSAPAEPSPEPRPPAQRETVDPKSSEAAVALVRAFAKLIEQKKFDEAYMLLGPNAPARSRFDHDFASYRDLEVSVGAAGDQEGAAGSIYLSVPVTISGDSGHERSSRSATVLLRRINDVPGSTEAQRHWHIDRLDWQH